MIDACPYPPVWSVTAAEALEILRGRRGGDSEAQIRAVARLIAERHPEVVGGRKAYWMNDEEALAIWCASLYAPSQDAEVQSARDRLEAVCDLIDPGGASELSEYRRPEANPAGERDA